MAWLFGSSKKTKPEVYVAQEVEDGFNYVTTRNPPPIPPRPQGGMSGAPYPTSPGPGYPLYPTLPTPYPPAPYLAVCPQAPPGYQPSPKPQTQHPLDSVPFKLSTSLEPTNSPLTRRIQSELESVRRSLAEINKSVSSPEYTYTFDLERSVLREESAVN